jgi:hypothetical protein
MPKELKPDDVSFHEVTDSAVFAVDRNFYKVEKWTTTVDRLLYAGNSLKRCIISSRFRRRSKSIDSQRPLSRTSVSLTMALKWSSGDGPGNLHPRN